MLGFHRFSISEHADYRFGFNGKEKDDEVKGNGNSLNFGARIHDPRIGRFLSLDPRAPEFPWLSPYAFAANNPIRFIDENGEGPGDGLKKMYVTRVVVSTETDVSGAVIENYKYFGRWYYENVTPAVAERLDAHGWFEVTKAQYDRSVAQNDDGSLKYPDAFTHRVYGADTPEQRLNFGAFAQQRMLPTEHTFPMSVTKAKDPSGTVVFGAAENNPDPAQFNLYAITPDGAMRLLKSVTVPIDGEVFVDYQLQGKEDALYIDWQMGDKPEGYSIGITEHFYKPEKKGDRAPDTIDNFGSEEPVQGVDF